MDIDELLRYTVERGASDLHLKAGNVPFVRVDGELSPAELGYLSAADTDRFADAFRDNACQVHACVRQNDHEFVTPVAREGIGIANGT